jgi:hypothetical protein
MSTTVQTKILHNVYSEDTLNYLRSEVDKRGVETKSFHEWEGPKLGQLLSVRYRLALDEHQDLRNMVLSPLPGDISTDLITHSFSHLRSFSPYEIHSDCGWIECNDDESPFYAFVIPLETCVAKTILLNQMHEGLHFVDYKKSYGPLPKDQQISDEDFQKYFSHCWPHEQEYISIQNVFDWTAGSVLMFDTRFLHASDNYILNGLQEKNAFILFSKVKTKNLSKYYQY